MGGAANLPAQNAAPTKRSSRGYFRYFLGALLVLFLFGFAIGPVTPGIPPWHAWHSIEMQQVRVITQTMLQYAQDHQGKFPTGMSSTEVFRKLIEGGYVEDSSLFYFPVKGKTRARDGQLLKPENVSFDVTSPVDSLDPDSLPLVFSTGFKVGYEPGASAVRLVPLDFRGPSFFEMLRPNPPDPGPSHTSIVIGSRHAEVWILNVTDDAADPNGSARDFIPVSFNAEGKTYRQLTPDGMLPGK